MRHLPRKPHRAPANDPAAPPAPAAARDGQRGTRRPAAAGTDE
ncbi:hypothetical protein [Burkholderia gladioli]|nr:hypothetical protein [Burkholderia gladioli]MDN7463301.1 hypothetical protein [Burkholderia gladioli]